MSYDAYVRNTHNGDATSGAVWKSLTALHALFGMRAERARIDDPGSKTIVVRSDLLFQEIAHDPSGNTGDIVADVPVGIDGAVDVGEISGRAAQNAKLCALREGVDHIRGGRGFDAHVDVVVVDDDEVAFNEACATGRLGAGVGSAGAWVGSAGACVGWAGASVG